MKALVTGGGGFLGGVIVRKLLARGDAVRSFTRTAYPWLAELGVEQAHGDLADPDAVAKAVEGCDVVFHLQANADVRHGLEHPRRDLEQNTIATANVLEAMRSHGASTICFSSTGSVYGDATVVPTPEDA